MGEHLTDSESDALVDACDGAGEYMCCHRGIHRETKEPVGGAMLDAVERIKADAYAAGVAAGRADAVDAIRVLRGKNPDHLVWTGILDEAARAIQALAHHTTGLPDAPRGPGDANRGAVGLGDGEDENGPERGGQR